MEENGEVVTRANMDCPEACLLPGGRWHSPLPPVPPPPLGEGALLHQGPASAPGRAPGLQPVTSWSGLGGGAPGSTLESEFGPPCLTSSRDCSDALNSSFRP